MEDVFENFIKYLEKLDDKDWNTLVDSNWTVKDVVAHLVGWEEEDINVLKEILETGKKPWFLDYPDPDYLEFNRKNVEKYKNYTPRQLLEKWRYFAKITEDEVKKIGQKNLKKKNWAFDESHYLEHFEQIKSVLGK